MPSWQIIRRHHYCHEYFTSILLVLLAVLIIISAIRTIKATTPVDVTTILSQRLKTLASLARADDCPYTMRFTVHSSAVQVEKWEMAPSRSSQVARLMPNLSQPLPSGIVVESTTLPRNEIVISDSGFTLSSGKITFRAIDGSRTTLDIGIR